MWRTAARLQYTKFSYTFKVTVHKIFLELLLILKFLIFFFFFFFFQTGLHFFINPPNTFHQSRSKPGGQLDCEVSKVHCTKF